MNPLIYHITTIAAWQAARRAGAYTADSLAAEGFIHCSTREQVPGTAERYFHGQPGLCLLELASAHVKHEIRYEAVPGGMVFPHIYGEINLDAVQRVLDFRPNADGSFSWPEHDLRD
jgi:uncharacterized protein (DUF952 family)